MGLDLGDLIRNIHPLHHFAEYRIAKVALAMVEEGVIRHVDEELTGGAILIGGTRLAMVPRVLRRPLSASFLIGGLGCFCCICSLKPPPCTMNPGITR